MSRAALILAIQLLACSPPAPTTGFEHHTLSPYPLLYRSGDPLWRPQPHRDHPLRVAITPDGARAYVTLHGLEEEPGHEVVAVDLATRQVLRRVVVGSSPMGVAVHPGGRFVVVTNRYSNWASVIDVTTDRVVADIPTDYYAVDIAFTPDGRRAYVSNRWHDNVVRWDLEVTAERFSVVNARAASLAVSTHPRDIAVSADGTRLAVAGLDGLRVALIELPSERRIADVDLRAPVNDVSFAGRWIVALTQGPGSGHPPLLGPDGDGDGRPGDSTANSNFQDQQNDIAIIDGRDGTLHERYTSDSICCRDFRDVHPDDPALGRFLPPSDHWIVTGSVPEALAVCGDPAAPRLFVAYQGSNELGTFDIDLANGTLRAVATGATGFAPSDVACASNGRVAVVTTLGEGLEIVQTPGQIEVTLHVGDVSGGRFPATDAEIGELVNVATAPFTVDGDQSCLMCHREFGAPDKAFSMPLLRYAEGTRNVMPHRGLADTRPWFFEAAMDENNFFPVLNEFARSENFCCTDPALWNDHPAPADCETHPPAACAARPWPRNFATRNAFYLHQSAAILGRTRTFGDAFDAPLNFQGLTKALGLSLLMHSRLLANPNPRDTAAVRRGRALFDSPEVGCAGCHSGEGFAASIQAGREVRLHFGPVITPLRTADGSNADLISEGFRATFPESAQDAETIEFGAPTLRNIWTHSRLYLHDGRAHSLREVLATPGHVGLGPGERGFNELDGVPNSHGATSQLSAQQLNDLTAYLLSL